MVEVGREEPLACIASTIELCLSRLASLVGSKFWGGNQESNFGRAKSEMPFTLRNRSQTSS